MDEQIPHTTLRTLSLVLIAVFDIAREGLSEVVERLRPLVEPPEDIRVVSTVGAIYTGVLVVERNTIIAGLIVEVGRVTATPRAPIVTPPPRYEAPGRFDRHDDPREGRLPGWAEDPRDLFRDEDEPWRR